MTNPLQHLWARLGPHAPAWLRPAIRWAYSRLYVPAAWPLERLYLAYRARRASAFFSRTGFRYLPPIPMRFRVAATTDLETFLLTGSRAAQDLERALRGAGYDWSDFRTVLDFGCGCGRVLGWLEAVAGSQTCLYGTEADPEAVRWCGRHLRFARFTRNGTSPPLPYRAQAFDLIYSVSVFSHLDADDQFAWLAELRRVARPGALVLVTVHGDHLATAEHLSAAAQAEWQRNGIVVVQDQGWAGHFGDRYHDTFHSRAYVLAEWSRYFRVLAYEARGLCGHQDLIVLQKEPATRDDNLEGQTAPPAGVIGPVERWAATRLRRGPL